MRVLIDTCVIIDAIQKRHPFNETAQQVLRLAAAKRFEGYITAKETTDLYYLIHHGEHDKEATKEKMSVLFTHLDVLDTRAVDVWRALDSPMTDYEDAVMVATAKREGMDCVVTRNLKDY